MNAIVPYIPPSPPVPSPQELGFGQTLHPLKQVGNPNQIFRQFEYARQNALQRAPLHGDEFRSVHHSAGIENDSEKFGVGKALKYMLYGLTGFFIGKFINNRLGLFNQFTFKNFLKYSALGIGGFHLSKWLLNKVTGHQPK